MIARLLRCHCTAIHRLRFPESRLASFLMIAAFHSSASSSPLTLEHLIESVDRSFPEILQADARAEAAKGRELSSDGAFDPMLFAQVEQKPVSTYENEVLKIGLTNQLPNTPLKVGLEYDRARGPFPSYDGDKLTGSEGRFRGFFEIPLLRDFGIDSARARQRIAEFESTGAFETSRFTRLNTFRRAAIQYWNWVAAVENQRIAEDLLSYALVRDTVLNQRSRTGDAPRIERVDNQRLVLQRRAILENAQLRVKTQAQELSLFFRDSQGTPITPPTDRAPKWLEPLNQGTQLSLAEQNRIIDEHPFVRSVEQELEVRKVRTNLSNWELLPKLDFRMSFSEELGSLPSVRSQAAETIGRVVFSFPLLNRQARGAERAARFEEEAAQRKLEFARQKLEVDLRNASLEAETAEKVYRLNFDEIDLARQVEAAERTRFKMGDSNLLMVNLREQDTAFARSRAISSLLEYRRKELELLLIANRWIKRF